MFTVSQTPKSNGLCCVKRLWRPLHPDKLNLDLSFLHRLRVVVFLSLSLNKLIDLKAFSSCTAAKTGNAHEKVIAKDSTTSGKNIIYISWCPPCRLSPRLTFVILLRTVCRLLSSSAFFQEAATGTSEEIQPWKQQNGMNFLCSNCIAGFLLMFCHVFYWSPSLRGSLPEQTPTRLTFTMSEGIIRRQRTRFPLQQCSVKAMSHKKRSSRCLYPTFANNSFAVWPTGGTMIKSLSLVWNTTTVFHIIQVTDSYNCPASKTSGQCWHKPE